MQMPTGRLIPPPTEDGATVVQVDRYRLVEANYRSQRFTYVYEGTE